MSCETLLFFDLDGTLMVNPFTSVIFPAIVEEMTRKTGLSEAFYELILDEHDARLDNPLENLPLTMDWEDIFQVVASRYGVALETNAETLVVQHAAPPHTSILDNALEVLAELVSEPHRKLIVSTMGLSKYQFPVIQALGLYDFFSDFLTPDRTGYLKFHPEFYQTYADSPALKIHVGDRYDHDCVYPHQFGAKTIMRLPLPELAELDPFERPQLLTHQVHLLPEFPEILPDAVIVNLAELPSVVRKLERS